MSSYAPLKPIFLLAVFFLFGMTSPLLAKLLPDILSGMSLQGMTINIPTPTALDAYAQFFKNIGQMGLLVALLLFFGMLSQEVSKGTLVILLAKGLSRHAVILSKYVAALVLWTVSYVLAAAVDYGYTVFLFGAVTLPNVFFSLFCLWLFGAFLLALILLASALTSGNYGGLLLTAGVLAVLLFLSSFEKLQKWNPVTLPSANSALLAGLQQPGDLTLPVLLTAALTLVCLFLTLLLFRKKRL